MGEKMVKFKLEKINSVIWKILRIKNQEQLK